MTFSQRLKKWRKGNELTMPQAARLMNTNPRTYEGWEYGRWEPKGAARLLVENTIQLRTESVKPPR